MFTSSPEGRSLGVKELNTAFWSGMENVSYSFRYAAPDPQLSSYVYASYDPYLWYLIATLEQLNSDYLPSIECNQLSIYIKEELLKEILSPYNLVDLFRNYLILQKFFIKKDKDQLDDLSFIDKCPKEIIPKLANNIEILIKLMLEQGRNMQDKRLAYLVNIWLAKIPSNEKSFCAILTDLTKIKKADPDEYLLLFDKILKEVILLDLTIIDFKKLVENLISTDRHECVHVLYKRCFSENLKIFNRIIIDSINNHPEKLQDYKDINIEMNAVQNKAEKDGGRARWITKPNLEDKFEKFINEHKDDLSSLKSINELQKYLENPDSMLKSEKSWVIYLCEHLGEYKNPSLLTSELKAQVLQVWAQELNLVKVKHSRNLSENIDKFIAKLNRFFPDTQDKERLRIMHQLLEALLKIYPNLKPGNQDIVINYPWQAREAIDSYTIYLKLLPDKPISLSQESGDKPMPFTMLWTSLALPNSDARRKISAEYERFISKFGEGYEKFFFQYQFVTSRLMLSMEEKVFEFLLRYKDKMELPALKDMMLNIAMLPISMIDVIGQLLEKFSAITMQEKDYKTFNEILTVVKMQFEVNNLTGSTDYKSQVDFYQKSIRESADLDDFHKNISGHLFDTAFPDVVIDKGKANLPHFLQEINRGNFATYIDTRKNTPFKEIFEEMLVYALIEYPVDSVKPVQSEEILDSKSVEQSSKAKSLREGMPEYKKFADNFKNINQALIKDEKHDAKDVRHFTEFLLTHHSIIFQLLFIVGKDTFSLLQKYMGKTVLPLEQLLKNLAAPGSSLETLHNTLQQAGISTPENFSTLCANAQYIVSLTSGLITLNQAGMPAQERMLTQQNFDALCASAQYAASLAPVLDTLNQAGMLTQKNFDTLCANAQYADSLSAGLGTLKREGTLTQENCALLCANPQYAHALAWGINILETAGVKTRELAPLSLDKIFKNIYTDNTEKFSNHEKIAAFFILVSSQEELIKKPTSSKMNAMVSEIQPKELRMRLKKIFNKMGAYNFMQDAGNLTLGVEIEYSNIPLKYKDLTEWVMSHIQKGWSHPGDGSVAQIGDSTYSGETTTPIISNTSEVEHAMLNIAFLQAMGGETNASCGLHVHIGVENIATPSKFEKIVSTIEGDMSRPYTTYQLEFIKQFLMIYKREELKFSPIERNYNHYTQAVVVDDINKIEKLSVLQDQVNPRGRHYEINLHAFSKHGTIEVRRFSGTTEETQIYSTMSMIAAITQEAKARTNAIFEKRCLLETKEDTSYQSLNLFFSKQKTERQRELHMLRVKPVQESALIENPTASERKPRTIYIYLNKDKDGVIEYESIDKNNKLAKGVIEDTGRFENIITKLKSNTPLDTKEKNQILLEVASQGHATISHRVEKMRTDLEPRLTTILKQRKIQ